MCRLWHASSQEHLESLRDRLRWCLVRLVCVDMSMVESGRYELAKIGSKQYFNSGLMLLDLGKMREVGLEGAMQKFLLDPPEQYWTEGRDVGE